MMIRARIEGNTLHPLDPIPFKDGDIVTIRFEKGLYSLMQELGSITASSDIDAVFNEMRTKKYYD
ncbi:MAG: antitoxin family protein [Methanoregula sp.]|nr:antitoxin family protein [Methanoregula sp.]